MRELHHQPSPQESDQLVAIEGIQGHRVFCSDAYRFVLIDELVVTCGPSEYRVLRPLLDHPDRLVRLDVLAASFNRQNDRQTQRYLARVISRLRVKLWPFDFDILCLSGHGYLLLTQAEPTEESMPIS